MDVYEPREDSQLIKKHIKAYAKGNVLDMGTGSGILAREASMYATSVIGLDINQDAVTYAKQHSSKDLAFFQSDLFQLFTLKNMQRTYDLIMFNPPYLPSEKYPNAALDGGKVGYELTERFLRQAKSFLAEKGTILLLVSSLTPKQKVERVLKELNYQHRIIDSEKHAFETLYVYEVIR